MTYVAGMTAHHVHDLIQKMQKRAQPPSQGQGWCQGRRSR